MAYDGQLAQRIRELLADAEVGDVVEKRMFGGLGFMVSGRLAIAASGQGGVMLRVDPAEGERLLDEPHVEPFVMRGRELAGWLRVAPEGVATREQLEPWVARALSMA
ncbi:MAG TPA: TfoX/Sxy family protein [Solirubrobacteraceae bacterium]|nr:TfoX/Sxy family protein [Solirubrobacteraceae bacterium]